MSGLPRRPTPGALVLLVAVATAFAQPIVPVDSDLWYHLRHGEEILSNLSLPTDTYFSYLEPPRPFVDYYWLFQVMVHGVHELAGFWGLWLLRGLGLTLLFFAAWRLLDAHVGSGAVPSPARDPSRSPRAWTSALLLALFAWILLGRGLNLRPHVFSYAFLALLLWRLERGGRPPWLFLLAAFWMNVHGVVYPLLLLVLVAHALDRVQEFLAGRCGPASLRRRLDYLGILALSILLTPYGLSLLPVPFRFGAGGEGSEVIRELAPPTAGSLLQVDLSSLEVLPHSVLVLWLWALVPALWWWLRRAPFRVSRILLLSAGVYLYSRGLRFHVELVLFSLPLWADLLRLDWPSPVSTRRPRLGAAVPALATLLAVAALGGRLAAGLALPHPLDDRGRLPAGVADFLRQETEGGRLMQPAELGGYLMWRLGPEYAIHMDLELPFAFSVEDSRFLSLAYQDAETLALLVERYRPDFLASSLRHPLGGHVARLPRPYQPVFFDDALVLWADATRHGDLVRRWRLREIDAERALAEPAYLPADPSRALPEIERILSLRRELRIARSLHVRSLLALRHVDEALASAKVFVDIAPDAALSHRLLGDALALDGDLPAALDAFDRALRRAEGDEKQPIHRRRALLHAKLGHFGRALAAMEASISDARVPSEDELQLLVRLAGAAGAEEKVRHYRRLRHWRLGETP